MFTKKPQSSKSADSVSLVSLNLFLHRVVSEEVLVGTEMPGADGGRGRLYLTVHCHHQNDFCIKMGSACGSF